MKLSIIINNYNYGCFLEKCIDSTLHQSQPADEVILVDDGSTDNSMEVAKAYEKNIQIVAQPNSGQAAAINAGFRLSSGDLILFLDADDYLHEDAVANIRIAWHSSFAKLQYRLWQVNETAHTVGSTPPANQALPSGDVRTLLLQTGRYGSMPTSGNVFSREALSQIMPIPPDEYRVSADLFLAIRITRCGNIGALEKHLGYYRVHRENQFQTGTVITVNQRQLINRVRSGFLRHHLLRQEATRDHAPMIIPYSIPMWIDRMIAHRFGLDTKTGENETMPVLANGFRQTLNQREYTTTLHRAAGVLLCVTLRYSPRQILRLLAVTEMKMPQKLKQAIFSKIRADF